MTNPKVPAQTLPGGGPHYPPPSNPRPRPPAPGPSKRPVTTTKTTAIPITAAEIPPGVPATIPLSLETNWFAATPPKFPPQAVRNLPNPIHTATYEWECMESAENRARGLDWTLIGAIQWAVGDMRTITKVRVCWNSADVRGSVRGEQKVVVLVPLDDDSGGEGDKKGAGCGGGGGGGGEDGDGEESKKELTEAELRRYADLYGPHVVAYCRNRVGARVGDGECWTLAKEALEEAGRVVEAAGGEGVMGSVGRTHGCCVLEWDAKGGLPAEGVLGLAGVRTGDVLEIEGGYFEKVKVRGGMRGVQRVRVRVGKHTAV
ncbi:hypothetical protein AJ79_06641, partial [Helicocarpus griseus UAMH5409]